MTESKKPEKLGAYTDAERSRASAWKQRTPALQDPARSPAPFAGVGGRPRGSPKDYCLPLDHARHNLLPEVRDTVLPLFTELGIPWHCGIDGGPGNHLLSSQVQCANALGQMVGDHDGAGLRAAFASVLDVGVLLPIEEGRYLTFEFIGPQDYLNESCGGARVRGANCTSVDAAFLHTARDGACELVLVEWKYTESYLRPRATETARDEVRRVRYQALLGHPDSPVDPYQMTFVDMLDEPFCQLFRQQLLAWQLESDPNNRYERVRIVHVAPRDNSGYQRSLVRNSHDRLGDTVSKVWATLLRRPDRFAALDSTVFVNSNVTSPEYVDRYGPGSDKSGSPIGKKANHRL